METTKLTLRPRSKISKLAHLMAKREKNSITQMFSDYILARQKAMESQPALGPLTQSLSGVVTLPENFDEKDFMSDILAKKHGESVS